ncbi:hypothetical protein ZWY2020_041572 [Hordeum vulgare]|nr:hypothetical protein ZWY2020_041572 [Hordeum vulgare]
MLTVLAQAATSNTQGISPPPKPTRCTHHYSPPRTTIAQPDCQSHGPAPASTCHHPASREAQDSSAPRIRTTSPPMRRRHVAVHEPRHTTSVAELQELAGAAAIGPATPTVTASPRRHPKWCLVATSIASPVEGGDLGTPHAPQPQPAGAARRSASTARSGRRVPD